MEKQSEVCKGSILYYIPWYMLMYYDILLQWIYGLVYSYWRQDVTTSSAKGRAVRCEMVSSMSDGYGILLCVIHPRILYSLKG